jgi:hypothetical protein
VEILHGLLDLQADEEGIGLGNGHVGAREEWMAGNNDDEEDDDEGEEEREEEDEEEREEDEEQEGEEGGARLREAGAGNDAPLPVPGMGMEMGMANQQLGGRQLVESEWGALMRDLVFQRPGGVGVVGDMVLVLELAGEVPMDGIIGAFVLLLPSLVYLVGSCK